MHPTLSRALLPLALGLSLLGCDEVPLTPDYDRSDASLYQIASCEEFTGYVGDVGLEMLLNSRYGYGYRSMPEAGVDSDAGAGDAPSDYTTTNVQEEGVDELDIVKTDGNFIYTVQDQGLHIVASWPVEDAAVLATVPLDGWARGLFLDGDTLYVFSWIYNDGMSGDNWLRAWSGTRVRVFDITDRSAPVETRTIDLEGYLADARLIDGNVYGVYNHWMYLDNGLWQLAEDKNLGLPEVDWSLTGPALEADMDAKREQARLILTPEVADWAASLSADDLLPRVKDSATGTTGSLLGCTDLYRPAAPSQYNVLSVVHLGAPDGELAATGIVSDGWTLYASQSNLYVAQTSWSWWWGWGDQEMTTRIHKFALGESGVPSYAATGEIAGWIYSQFAMSEHDGHLRVTTTEMDWWRGWWSEDTEPVEAGNNVFVLKQGAQRTLETVGHVGGIAPGEQIFATRMMGDKGYMVTFEQVDPLFTLDLSDPTDPRVVGELKIPGYSAYLHPMGPDHLLAVGMAGLDDGTLTGLAINVFDVSDMANPTLLHAHEIDDQGSQWSWSEALWDHHAFTWHRDVLTIPAYSYNYDALTGSYDYFSGTISFDATPAGIAEIGRVDHRELVLQSECVYDRYDEYNYWDGSVCDDWAWYASVRRSIYIEDNLFTVSNYGIRVTDLNDPTVERARVVYFPR